MGVKIWPQASCYTFSRLRQKAAMPLAGALEILPVWRNVYFCNEVRHSYFSPKLARKGVLTLSHIMEGGGWTRDVVLPPMATGLSSGAPLPVILADSKPTEVSVETFI